MDELLRGGGSALLLPLGLVLPATSRGFLPPFVAALYIWLCGALGNGTQFAALADVAHAESPWFTSSLVLVVFGLLAAIDVAATKNQHAEALLRLSDPVIKPVMVIVTSQGLAATGAIPTDSHSDAASMVGSLLAGGLVFIGVFARHELLELLDDLDLDELFLSVAWAEDFLVVGSVVLLFLLGPIMLVIAAITCLGLWALEKAIQRWGNTMRRPCAQCTKPQWPHGFACASCGAENQSPAAVGFFGLPKRTGMLDDHVPHQVKLLKYGRCPRCAELLQRSVGAQTCQPCGNQVFVTEAAISTYAEATGPTELRVIVACALLGLIPIVGMVPAIVLYRSQLVAPYRRYLPFAKTFGLRWAARGASLALTLLQWIPLVGLVALPLMAVINHRLYRRSFVATAREQAREVLKLPAARTTPTWVHTVTRVARPIFLPGLAALSLGIAVVLMTSSSTSALAVHCPSDAERVVGRWDEDFFPLPFVEPLLAETFASGGGYTLNGAAGSFAVEPGRMRIAMAAGTGREYRFWVTNQRLYYMDESTGRLSVYVRTSPPLNVPFGCPSDRDRVLGSWRGRDGETISVTADAIRGSNGLLALWNGQGTEAHGLGAGGEVVANEAGELLVVDHGVGRVLASTNNREDPLAEVEIVANIPAITDSGRFEAVAAPPTPIEEPIAAPVSTATRCRTVVDFNDPPLFVRTRPTTQGTHIGDLENGSVVTVTERRGPWTRIAAPSGWVWAAALSERCTP